MLGRQRLRNIAMHEPQLPMIPDGGLGEWNHRLEFSPASIGCEP